MSVIRPGDTVLIGAASGASPTELQHVKDQLQTTFPGVSFLVMAGLTVEGVVRPEAVS